MLNGIDHVVFVVPSLAVAIEEFRTAGFTVIPGGRHTSGLSENALVPFADGAYFELFAFLDLNTPNDHPRWPLVAKGGGLADFHVLTNAIERDANRLRAARLDYSAPYPLGRVRIDGQECRWRLAASPWPTPPFLPYLIEDETPRDLRVPGGVEHLNGVLGISEIVLAVEDLSRTATAWSVLLEQRLPALEPDPAIGATAARFSVGATVVRLVASESASGPVAGHLNRRGESIYEVVLSGAESSGRLALPRSGDPAIIVRSDKNR